MLSWCSNERLKIIWKKLLIKNLPPWNISYKHPISILVFISWHILRTIQKIYQFAFIHEIFRSLWATVTFNVQDDYLEIHVLNKSW